MSLSTRSQSSIRIAPELGAESGSEVAKSVSPARRCHAIAVATVNDGAAYPHTGRRIHRVSGGANADALSPLRRHIASAFDASPSSNLPALSAGGLVPSSWAQRTGGTVSNATDVAAHDSPAGGTCHAGGTVSGAADVAGRAGLCGAAADARGDTGADQRGELPHPAACGRRAGA